MTSSKSRRSPSIIESSQYARGRSPRDERRHELESLKHDREAIARAKQEFAAISRQQLGRAGAQVQLDDVEAQQRKPLYTAVGSEPLPTATSAQSAPGAPPPETHAHAAANDETAGDGHVPTGERAAARGPDDRAHRPARGFFQHIEHKDVFAAPSARTMPTDAAAEYPRRERPITARPPIYEPYPLWEAPRALARGPFWLLLGALVCAVIIWMFARGPNTFISTYGGLPLGSAANNASGKGFGPLNTPPGEHSVLGEPTITAAAIDAILAEYSSPAAGTGQAWLAMGRRYGIDPAYALAFFIHESSAGTNPGWAGFKANGDSTHNIGNIICAGYSTCYGRFRDYASWEEGINDWYKLIRDEYINGRGTHTVEEIIPIYAPASDNNDVPGYIRAVLSMVDNWRQGVLR
jgi:hypothetical protein